jgi:hypothetical protein
VSEIDVIEAMLMEMLDSRSKMTNPEDLGMEVDENGIIID